MLDHTATSLTLTDQIESCFSQCNYTATNDATYECQKLLEPFNYINSDQKDFLNGNRFVYTFSEWFNLTEDQLELFRQLGVVIVDTAWIIDDLYDGSLLRRGRDSTHVKYGTARALNSSFLAQLACLRRFRQINPLFEQIVRDEMIQFYYCTGMENVYRDTFTCPTQEDYVTINAMKTAACFLAFTIPPAKFSGFKYEEELVDYTYKMALFYALIDDWSNLKSKTYHKLKGYCEDFADGKFTSFIVYAIQQFPNDNRIPEILRKRPKDRETIDKALIILEELGAFEHVRKMIYDVHAETKSVLSRMPPNNLAHVLIDKPLTFMTN